MGPGAMRGGGRVASGTSPRRCWVRASTVPTAAYQWHSTRVGYCFVIFGGKDCLRGQSMEAHVAQMDLISVQFYCQCTDQIMFRSQRFPQHIRIIYLSVKALPWHVPLLWS